MRPVVHPVSGFLFDAESFTHAATAPQWVIAPAEPDRRELAKTRFYNNLKSFSNKQSRLHARCP
jgi:hypothetical protein